MNDTYLQMIRGEKPSHTPVWFMRQAGRSQAEYRRIKEKYSLFEITRQPELCAYITQLPVEEYGVDAAILYKDIMTPLPGMGVEVDIKAGVGPVIDRPIRTKADIDRLQPFSPDESVPYIMDTISLVTKSLTVPLIGFGGAPFTLASYLVEGGPSKNYLKTKALMLKEPELWHLLMNKLSDMCIIYLGAQIQAGAQALQLFDSWVGALNVAQYEAYIFPHVKRIVSSLKEAYPTVPITMQAVGAGHLIELWQAMGVDVIGLDWRLSIMEAANRGLTTAVQGNLDPAYLFAPWPVIEKEVTRILAEGKEYGRHIFNLGHGVVPETNPEVLKRIVELVHGW